MEKTYYITMNTKTPDGGFETYGSFELGQDKNFASELFRELRGEPEVSEHSVLTMDLTELDNGIPFVFAARHCTLDDLSQNTKRITCAIFKRCALDGKV